MVSILVAGVGRAPTPDRLANETGDIHAEGSWVADGATGDALPVRRCQNFTHSDIFLSPGAVLSSAPFVHPVTVTANGKQALAAIRIRCDATPGTYKVLSTRGVRDGGNTLGLIHVLSQAEEDALAGVGKHLVIARGKTHIVQVHPCDTVKRIYSFTDFPKAPTSGLTLRSAVFDHGAQAWDGVNAGIVLIHIRCDAKPGIYDVRSYSDGQSYGGSGSSYFLEKFEVIATSHPKATAPIASTKSSQDRSPAALAVGSATSQGRSPTALAVGSATAILGTAALVLIGLRRRAKRSKAASKP